MIRTSTSALVAVGSTDSTLTDIPAGDYSLTWGTVDGWDLPNPNPATALLEAGSRVTFSGTYTEPLPGTIVVNTAPDIINASWQLSGPDGFVMADTGDLTLNDLVAGDYSIEWGYVFGWISPSNSTRYLVAGGTLTFAGNYAPDHSTAQEFVLIPPASVDMPATFTMGSNDGDDDETPHQVTLTRSFIMASTEVTNGQFFTAMQWAYDQGHISVVSGSVRDNLDGSTKELFNLDEPDCQITFYNGIFATLYSNHPVFVLPWFGAVAYCDWLSLQDGLPRAYDHSTWSCNNENPYNASGYRLPTEAEWEFACRAGTTTPFNTGDCLDSATEANYNGIYAYTGCPVGPHRNGTLDAGSFPANQWELHDMHGNVFEWCNDRYENYSGDVTDPEGAEFSEFRVLRGGGWGYDAYNCRSAYRLFFSSGTSSNRVGFRPVRSTS